MRDKNQRTILLILVAVFILVGLIIFLARSFSVADDEDYYCERALSDTGLDLKRMHYSIEEKYCESAWIDAAVYFKLRMSIANARQIVDEIVCCYEYKGDLSFLRFPAWWITMPDKLHFAYCKDNNTASPIIIVDIDMHNDFAFIYIAVLPI